jgi:hypothetical protein
MSKRVKFFAIIALIGGAVVLAPIGAVAQHSHHSGSSHHGSSHYGGSHHGGWSGPSFYFGSPGYYYYYYGSPYSYGDPYYYAPPPPPPECDWEQVRV